MLYVISMAQGTPNPVLLIEALFNADTLLHMIIAAGCISLAFGISLLIKKYQPVEIEGARWNWPTHWRMYGEPLITPLLTTLFLILAATLTQNLLPTHFLLPLLTQVSQIWLVGRITHLITKNTFAHALVWIILLPPVL